MPEPPSAMAIATSGSNWVVVRGESADAGEIVDLDTIRQIETDRSPRWIWWSQDTARSLVEADVRPRRCWDLGAVHRLLVGGWRGDPARVWAAATGLDPSDIPSPEAPNLFSPAQPRSEGPIRPDGHLHPEWSAGRWADDGPALCAWAALAVTVHEAQRSQIAERCGTERPARVESAASVLCAELEHDGLPVDHDTAERTIASFLGPRPANAEEAARQIEERDAQVLDLLPPGFDVDLRNPAQIKSMLRRLGVEVPDTRAWRLEALRDTQPAVDALLRWRKAERIATTFGYGWLDENVGSGGRLRGSWTPSDGAAGRMTATAGLHNLPTALRTAVAAEPGHALVRADLGQIEPRVLAAVSGDESLARATVDDDLYAPVAQRLGVEREIAKVAVLGAMYGQTTGHGAAALAGLEREYPVAMQFLREADHAAQGGRDLYTVGGRRIRLDAGQDAETTEQVARSRAAARGRFGRNAVVQGAAAEFFKTWAALVRARCASLDAQIVLCLHDELIVHAATADAQAVAAVVEESVAQAAGHWTPPGAPAVRFIADVSVLQRWSEAK